MENNKLDPIKHAEEYHKRAIERILNFRDPSPNTRKNNISEHNLRHLRNYAEFLNFNLNKPRTIELRLKAAKYFLDYLDKKKLEDAKREDIEDYLYSKSDWAETTKETYKLHIKLFFRWFSGSTKEYPEIVSWIRPKNNVKSSIENYEVLTKKEKKKIIEAADSIRDKCLVSMLSDSGARISEITNMIIKDCDFDEYGCKIKVSGKTGTRKIRLIESVPLLKEWINHHPLGKSVQIPLFICLGKKFGEPLSPSGGYRIIRKLTKRAKITKRVSPHVFRHTKLTELARAGLNEFELRIYAGWSKQSKMSEVYIHIGEKEVEEKLLNLNGIVKKEEKEEEEEKNKICFSCKTQNDVGNKFCSKCNQMLDMNGEREINVKDNLMQLIEEDGEIKERLIEKLKEQFKNEIMKEITK